MKQNFQATKYARLDYWVRRENLYTQIIYIILSCINATKTFNTANERQLCELSKYERFFKAEITVKVQRPISLRRVRFDLRAFEI